MGFFYKYLYRGPNKMFKPNTANPEQESAAAIAAQTGRAQNLTTAAGNWLNDPQRAKQQQDFMDALRAQLGDQTNLDFGNTSRATTFKTARQGLTGGSTDVNRQKLNLQDLFKRQLGNETQVQDAGNQLHQQDLGTYQSMIDSAYGAADTGQDTWRNLIEQRAGNNAAIPGLLHQHLARTGKMWMNYGAGKAGSSSASEGFSAGSS